MTVDEYCAVGNVICTENKVNKGCLTGACLTNEADVFSGIYLEGYVFKCIVLTVGITECEISEFDISADISSS